MMRPSPDDGGQADRLSAALQYLVRGWSVVPAGERQKRPIIRWQRYQEALPTEQDVRGWFTRWPMANLSVVTGAVSGIVVLDVDPHHGGEESLNVLEACHGALPKTVEAVTGSGGRHLYFAHPGFRCAQSRGFRAGPRSSRRWRRHHRATVDPPEWHALSMARRAITLGLSGCGTAGLAA